MTRRNTLIVRIGSTLVALGCAAGCQVVADTSTRTADPLVEGCTLPASGAYKFRLASFNGAPERADFCIRPSSAESFRRPFVQDVGTACPRGLSYPQVTQSIATDWAEVDVRVVDADDFHCTTPLAEVSHIKLDTAASTTLAFTTGADGKPKVAVMPEHAKQSEPVFRFANMLMDPARIVFGVSDGVVLPTKISASVTLPVEAGAAAPPSDTGALGAVDANGYIIGPARIAPSVGASLFQSSDALLALPLPVKIGMYSVYAIGSRTDAARPLRGLLCDETGGAGDAGNAPSLLAPCTLTTPPSIVVTTLNLDLAGASPSEDLRRPHIVEELRTRPSDILCLTSTYRPSDKQLVIDGLKDLYPYAAKAVSDLDTPLGDPHDLTGKAIEPWPAPPCANVPQSTLDDLYQCFLQNCCDANGVVTDASCKGGLCNAQIYPLFIQNTRCLGCNLTGAFSGAAVSTIAQSCSADTRTPYAFNGSSGPILLSKYPISDEATVQLPATIFRESVLYATVTLDGKQRVRVFCGEFSNVVSGADLPYFGNAGAGPDSNGWANEQLLEARQTASLVSKVSGDGVPAIFTGELEASAEYRQGDQVLIAKDGADETLKVFSSPFAEAIPDGYAPACTKCSDKENPFNSTPFGTWTLHTFLYGNWPSKAALSAEVVFKDKIVPYNGDFGPISTEFGYSVRLLRPRAD